MPCAIGNLFVKLKKRTILKEDLTIIKKYSSMGGEGCQSFSVLLAPFWTIVNEGAEGGGEYVSVFGGLSLTVVFSGCGYSWECRC
jgi:hypothetical protein